jgi:transposase
VRMRGDDRQPDAAFSYVSMESRIPLAHPLRPMRTLVDACLREMSPRFAQLYARTGRPSIPPEKLLRAQLLQGLYTIRSERLLMEQLDYHLLFRWFVGLTMDDPVWDPTVFTKNRERLLAGDVARGFLEQVLAEARAQHLLSNEHFSVDGTLIEAWASLKSFQRKGAADGPPPDDPGNPTIDVHGERRSNTTHGSTTDPDARLYRKGGGHEAKRYHQGHVLMENRHGLVVDGAVTPPAGTRERETAVEMISRVSANGRLTLGADTGYDTREFVDGLREMAVTPHVTQHTTNRASALDDRTTRHRGDALSQRARRRIEEIFGWLKTIALLRKTRHRGTARVEWMFLFGLAAYHLVRMRNLATQSG